MKFLSSRSLCSIFPLLTAISRCCQYKVRVFDTKVGADRALSNLCPPPAHDLAIALQRKMDPVGTLAE
jgi:hypothetical protein